MVLFRTHYIQVTPIRRRYKRRNLCANVNRSENGGRKTNRSHPRTSAPHPDPRKGGVMVDLSIFVFAMLGILALLAVLIQQIKR